MCISSIENAFGKASKHRILQTKLENLALAGVEQE